MSPEQFAPGQRWISNTESELGLGIVVENRNRRVRISFPAAGEQRIYAVDGAPLTRVRYPLGEKIFSADGIALTVASRRDVDGCVVYRGTDPAGKEVELHELDLDSFVRFSKPQDRLFAGQIDRNSSFDLRVETLGHRHRLWQLDTFGLHGPRVQLLPHQLYIAHQVGQRHAPRVLLADEVGLGKTIEAGLILHQLLLSGRVNRVLIVVPDSLVHQWLVEMLRRFNLMFTILDADRCQALTGSECEEFDEPPNKDKVNPFEAAQLVLCSLAFLTDNPRWRAAALAADWDLLVVDEAHHLSWHPDGASPEYRCIEAMAREVRGLLLLTATPEQLGQDGHFARLRLLDPDRYFELDQFRREEAGYRAVSELVQRLLAEDAPQRLRVDARLLAELKPLLDAETLAELSAALDGDRIGSWIDDAIDSLLDRHGTGRVLFRNTRDLVSGFPERTLHSYPLAAPNHLDELHAGASLEQRLHPEHLLGELWLDEDPRVTWLVAWLAEHRREKALLICACAGTADALEEHLRLRHGVRSAVFHEGMGLVTRDRAAAYFADEEDSAQVLVCSEIGSEGRNFQFAHHLILFDLPLNPDLLEQRIGRLDRIGQRHGVQIHVPFYEHGAQAILLHWYHEGLNAFEQVCEVGAAVYEQFAEPLHYCLDNIHDEETLADLVENTRRASEAIRLKLQQGRDRLLELNSCRPRRAAELVDRLVNSANPLELANYLEKLANHFGLELENHSADSVVVRPGDHMLTDSFPGLPEEGLTATWDRSKALSREDMQFLTWEHPLVTGAIDLVLDGNFGNTALCTIKLPPIKPGTLLLELIFTIHCPAPQALQLHRYLHQPMQRMVIEGKGNDLSGALTSKHLAALTRGVPQHNQVELVGRARTSIGQLIERGEVIASNQFVAARAAALEKMRHGQEVELKRLTALAKINPNIRREEIEHLRDSTELMEHFLQGAQMNLDAIRVIIAT